MMEKKKNTWHWLALAISLCQITGLHQNTEKLSDRQLSKRMFWSSIMRDRLVTLATGNPELIRFEECDIPMLPIDEFEILDSSWNKSCVNGCTFLDDEELQRRLARMCFETAKLCIPPGRILETVRSPTSSLLKGYV
jgi:hypothetical protein